MRCHRVLPLLIATSLASASAARAALVPVTGSDGKPLEVTASVPSMAGLGLSLAMPGGGQFYAGDSSRGWIYLGTTAGLTAAAYLAQKSLFYSSDAVILPESMWAMIVQGLVISWLGVGIASAIDAGGALGAKQPAWSSVEPEPGARP